MRVFTLKKITLGIAICIFVLTSVVTIPVVNVLQRLSPETKEYWTGSKDIIWNVNTQEKVIALTFDDGPSLTFTPQILDILKKNKVKATFFVIANEATKYPEIVRRMVDEGHEVANHTYNHHYLNRFGEKALKEEILQAEETLIRITGLKPVLFRPPGGYFNERIVKVSKELKYTIVIWSWEQQPKDWANPGTFAIIRSALKKATGGNIIVMHDRGGDRIQTVQALQPIIEGLKEKGFRLVTVSEMIKLSS
jgi:polysaccharide deacetylase family sporulation protein PdaB